MSHLSEQDLKKLFLVLSLYLTSLFAANTLGLKLMPFIFGTHLSVAIFSFPIVFLTTDVVGEVYGKPIAKLFVLAGFLSTAAFIGYSIISLAMPWSSHGLWVQTGYEQVFGVSIRIAIASLSAFLIAEYQDVISFFYFKAHFEHGGFWARSLFSNLWSQLLDTTIFIVIAFAGIYSTSTLLHLIMSWWIFKVAMGSLYTPLSYLGIRLLTSYDHTTL